MSLTPEQPPDVPVRSPEVSISPWSRTAAIFARPHQAWSGLDRRVQWWFPVLLMALLSAALMAGTFDQALLPSIVEPLEKQVADGQLPAAQLDRIVAGFTSPAGRAAFIGSQVLVGALLALVVGLFVWFGGAFLLGRKFGYRLALEVAAWSSLVTLPGAVLTYAIAYFRGASLRDVHLGFGALLGETETPSRLVTGLTVFLDAIGPLGVWYVAVVVLGLSALSGAPRRQSAWVISGLYLGLAVLGAALAAVFAPGS